MRQDILKNKQNCNRSKGLPEIMTEISCNGQNVNNDVDKQ